MGDFTFNIKRRIGRILKPVTWYNLRSVQPVSHVFGLDRGVPIDRYYIEQFLDSKRHHLKGTVLEIAENVYSKKFGGEKVSDYRVLHYDASSTGADLVGDLTDTSTLPYSQIDCFICTQTFQFIYDFKEAIKGAHYLLKEDGVLLATIAGISQISRYDMERWGDYWRFTTLTAQKAFEEVFGEGHVKINSYGNVLAAIAFLEGITIEDLSKEELDYRDPNYQLLITVEAIK